MESSLYDKVAVYRPVVPVGKAELGFLPGTLDEKLNPWMTAVHDALVALTERRSHADARAMLDELTEREKLTMEAVTYLRGRSLLGTLRAGGRGPEPRAHHAEDDPHPRRRGHQGRVHRRHEPDRRALPLRAQQRGVGAHRCVRGRALLRAHPPGALRALRGRRRSPPSACRPRPRIVRLPRHVAVREPDVSPLHPAPRPRVPAGVRRHRHRPPRAAIPSAASASSASSAATSAPAGSSAPSTTRARRWAISLGDLPLGYRQTVRLIPGMADMSATERDEICDAWAQPLRERGVEVVARAHLPDGGERATGRPAAGADARATSAAARLVTRARRAAGSAGCSRRSRPGACGRMRAAIAGAAARSASSPGPTPIWPASRRRCSGRCGSCPGSTRCRRTGCSSACRSSAASAAVLAIVGWRERGDVPRRRGAACSCSTAAGRAAARSSTTTCPCSSWRRCWPRAPVGIRWTDERRGAAWGWPVRTSIVVVTGIYFLTGFQKLVASGPAWVLSDNLRNVMYGAAAHRARRPPTRCRASSPTARCSRTASPSSRSWSSSARSSRSCWPRTRVAYVVAVAVLHVGVYLTHGLDYSMWVGTAAIVLIDWRPAARSRLVSGRRRAARRSSTAVSNERNTSSCESLRAVRLVPRGAVERVRAAGTTTRAPPPPADRRGGSSATSPSSSR